MIIIIIIIINNNNNYNNNYKVCRTVLEICGTNVAFFENIINHEQCNLIYAKKKKVKDKIVKSSTGQNNILKMK